MTDELERSLIPLITTRKEIVDRAAEEPGELPSARNGDRRVPLTGNVTDVGLRDADRFSDSHLGDTRDGNAVATRWFAARHEEPPVCSSMNLPDSTAG